MTTLLALAALAPTSVSGWVTLWNPDSPTAFVANAPKLQEALVGWIDVDENGIARRNDFAKAEALAPIKAAAKKNNVKLFAMAANYAEDGFDPVRVTKFLQGSIKRDAHVENLVAIAKEDGFDGIDLDYESIRAIDKNAYSEFVEKLAAALRKEKKLLSVTVHPKTEDLGTWDGPRAQDYARIGKAADIVRIMAYDQHWSGSEKGPIASNAWVDAIAAYAVTKIDPSKIDLGVSAYGYDWASKPATSLTWKNVPPGMPIKIDPDSGERTWGNARFSGPESLKAKLEIVAKHKLRGISFWYVGSESPDFWTALP